MLTAHIPRRRKRRTCCDRLRRHWLVTRRARISNPAASAVLQLLGVFHFLLDRMPVTAPTPARYAAPLMSPRHAERIETARRLGVPTRYLDIILRSGKVPYSLLAEHIRLGGATRRDALDELRKTVPAEALDWLNHVQKRALWSDLSRCFHPDASDEDTHLQLLKATLAWVEAQKNADSNPSGPAEAGQGFKPSILGENKDPDDDPQRPRP